MRELVIKFYNRWSKLPMDFVTRFACVALYTRSKMTD